jgi:hypothetical protein
VVGREGRDGPSDGKVGRGGEGKEREVWEGTERGVYASIHKEDQRRCLSLQ